MPVEVSIVQLMSLGVLCATVVFLFLLLLIGALVARKVMSVASRFLSVGAERKNGLVQMRGVFNDAPPVASSEPSALALAVKELTDFSPSPEDLHRQHQIEQNAAGARGDAN